MKILVIGELNPDLVLKNYTAFPTLGTEVLVEDLVLALGSASAICAAGLARLGNEVSFAGKVGTDTYGDFCVQAIRELGVDTSRILRDPNVKTGLTVSISCARDRALVTYLGAIGSFSVKDLPQNVLEGFEHLHISSYFLQQSLRPSVRQLFEEAHKRGMTTSLDPGFDPAEQWSTDLIDTLQEVDVFLPNEVELRAISGVDDVEAALRKLQNGRTLTVAKLGGDGCAALKDGSLVRVPVYPVKPVDTTGAGDSFNAGFLHAWLRKNPLEYSMRFASICGALSTLGVGGTGSQATAAEVEERLLQTTGGNRDSVES